MSDYCEVPQWYSGKWPKARKQYRCVECDTDILIGEKHGSFSGKWDGEVQTHRQHLLCEEACRHIRDYFNDGECIGFGELFDCWRDFAEMKKCEKGQHFRRVMARIIWRRRKKRALWLGSIPVFNVSLRSDRAQGHV